MAPFSVYFQLHHQRHATASSPPVDVEAHTGSTTSTHDTARPHRRHSPRRVTLAKAASHTGCLAVTRASRHHHLRPSRHHSIHSIHPAHWHPQHTHGIINFRLFPSSRGVRMLINILMSLITYFRLSFQQDGHSSPSLPQQGARLLA